MFVHLFYFLDSTISYSICLSLLLISLGVVFSYPPMLPQMARFHSFLQLSNFPLCMYTQTPHFLYLFIFLSSFFFFFGIPWHVEVLGSGSNSSHSSNNTRSLTARPPGNSFIYLLMGTWVTSVSWFFWIMLQWTQGCIYLFELVFLFSLDKYPGVELLDPMVVLFLMFWRNSILFSIVAAPIYIRTNRAWGFPFLHTLTNPSYLLSFW